MLKHKVKVEPVLKHKREPLPWELHPPGSARSKKEPEGFDEREYKAHLDADAFIWMIYWASSPDHKFDLDETVNYWWKRAFADDIPFPNEGGIAADLVDRIYCRLIDRGHEFQRIEPQESDYELPEPLLSSEYWKKIKGRKIVYIQQTMEAKMAKISQKKSAKADAKSTGAPPKVSKTANKTVSSNAVKAPKESAAKPSTAKVKGACMVSKKKKVVIKKK